MLKITKAEISSLVLVLTVMDWAHADDHNHKQLNEYVFVQREVVLFCWVNDQTEGYKFLVVSFAVFSHNRDIIFAHFDNTM